MKRGRCEGRDGGRLGYPRRAWYVLPVVVTPRKYMLAGKGGVFLRDLNERVHQASQAAGDGRACRKLEGKEKQGTHVQSGGESDARSQQGLV